MLCDCVLVCVYVGGVVDVVECGLFFSLGVCGWIVSLSLGSSVSPSILGCVVMGSVVLSI